TGRWARGWLGWDGFSKFFSQLVGWTFPGEETGGIEASFVTEGGATKLRVESVAEDGSPRDFYSTGVALTTPDLESRAIALDQVAPGVYEAPLGEIDAGAYVIRVSQTRPGSTPLGRTLGLVAPTPAEYRLLGANEPFLATLRAATGGRAIATAAEPWTHDLATTDTYQDLWPTLLIIALLLWPLDIALRRVSIGRRELADARRWVAGGWRRGPVVAPRPAEVAGMLAARDRAAGSVARAALLRGDSAVEPAGSAAVVDAAAMGRSLGTEAAPRSESPSPVRAPTVAAATTSSPPAPPTGAAAGSSTAPADPPDDTLARLREAKRRARGS
ncbi:MAG TPA: hypothetical protein VFO78_03020, partial [Candidatus Limnocylindrales bacterium]|nr:hypothetical protein [Candidatus Limnocylindrales bacterium]